MTEQLHHPDATSVEPAGTERTPAFYVVSPRKFIILYLATFSLYAIYWFYKNWANYRDWRQATPADASIWPIPRAIFSIFFIHSLFRKVKHAGQHSAAVQAWGNTAHAWLLVAFMLISSVLDRLSARGIGSPSTDVGSIAMLVTMLFAFMRAQRMINLACEDAAGAGNDQFSGANKSWVVVGCIMWLLALLGMVGMGVTPGSGETF